MARPFSRRAVLTLATGKPFYIRMAVNLARSFKWWHKNSLIRFFIATDQKEHIPRDLQDIEIIELKPAQYGQGFSPKLYLDKLAPADQTIFIDADCLCTGPLEPAFDRFAGHAVSVVGGAISEGEWFGDVAAVCRQFGVSALPKFNGGLYYLEKCEERNRVYATVRELESRYDEIGLVRLRNRANEELLMAIAMALHNQKPIPDDGSISGNPLDCAGELSVDVVRGKSKLINSPQPDPMHRLWHPFAEARPLLVHFLGHHATTYPYKREELRLALAIARGWPIWAAYAWVALFCSAPLLVSRTVKNILRPLFHQFFGPRPVSISERA